MTLVQSQYMLCPPLACKTARTQQQLKSLHSGTSPEKPDRDSKRNSIKCLRSPTNMDSQKPSPWKRLTRQTSLLWRSTETSSSTCKGPMVQQSKGWDLQNWRRVWFSDESRFILQKRDGRTRVYRRWNKRITRNCVLEVDNFVEGSVMMPYPTPEKLNWCASPTTLAPLDTYMMFWHHICCPQWISVGMFSARQHWAAHSSCYCWLSSQPERKSAPWPS